jgi:hypothetical protein
MAKKSQSRDRDGTRPHRPSRIRYVESSVPGRISLWLNMSCRDIISAVSLFWEGVFGYGQSHRRIFIGVQRSIRH